MSERVLLAERHPDGRYECLRLQWADTDALLRAVAESHSIPEPHRDDGWTACGRKRWQRLVDDLSYLTFDLCIRRDESGATAYLPVWAGIPTGERDETPANCGVLVRVDSPGEYDRLRRRLRQQKARLGVAIERGDVGVEATQRRLLVGLRPRVEFVSASARHLLDTE